jgi:hypothetical protein
LRYDSNYLNGYDIYKNIDVFTIQYPFGEYASSASGLILNIYDFQFDHNIPTEEGSSGCPIILLNSNINLLQVIGIHKNTDIDKKVNGGTFIGEIINQIKNDENGDNVNFNFNENFNNANININLVKEDNNNNIKNNFNLLNEEKNKNSNNIKNSFCLLNDEEDNNIINNNFISENKVDNNILNNINNNSKLDKEENNIII